MITMPLSEIRKSEFTMLKDWQHTLNMQIRLAMQMHDAQTQEELERQLAKVMEQMKHINC